MGFRAWDEPVLREKWQDAVAARESERSTYTGRLGAVAFEDVRAVDEALRGYDVITE